MPTLRERFHGVMNYHPVGALPNFEFGYWDETLPVWHQQGLAPEIDSEAKAYEYFGIENWATLWTPTGLCPTFEPRVLEETETHKIVIDHEGVKKEVSRNEEGRSIPKYLQFPVHDRESWERVKRERLDPDHPGRINKNWLDRAKAQQEAGLPVAVWIGSMYGVPRNLIGFEGISMMLYDDRELVEDVVETMCRIVETALDRLLPEFTPDFAAGWEDICFNNGPMISPKMFREICVPRYQRITRRLRDHCVRVVWTDCDGDVTNLVPCFLDGGVNCMFPLEVRAGSDPVRLREKFGKDLLLVGGVDKMVLRKSPKEIEAELRRLLPLVQEGGFIPTVDHRVPPDVSLENYKAYQRIKRDLFGTGGHSENL